MISANIPSRRRIAADLEASRAIEARNPYHGGNANASMAWRAGYDGAPLWRDDAPILSKAHRAGTRAARASRRPAWRAYAPAVLLVLAAMVLLTWGLAGLARADVRAVSLSDASAPPASLVYLYPGASVTLAHARTGYTCAPAGRYFSDVSAYRWDGSALGPQRWEARALRYVWRDHAGRAVTWDGATWRNHTGAPVLVAGWC